MENELHETVECDDNAEHGVNTEEEMDVPSSDETSADD